MGHVIQDLPHRYGKYELVERIGVGGMAEVFRAKMPGAAGFEKTIVIKRILPHLTGSPAFTAMFVAEAKLAARVQHKNVVQVFELGEVDGELYIAMEHVEGTDLRGLLRMAADRQLRLPVWFSIHVVNEVLSALGHAHELTDDHDRPLTIVHRDVTPSNIFVSRAGDIKLADFGIAKSGLAAGGTRAGQLKGKVSYMPPEQILNEPIDARADVFAAGVVLWECLTQRRLFGGRSEFETMKLVCDGSRRPPSVYNREVSPELDGLVLAALDVFPENRPRSAADFQRGLLEVLSRMGVAVLPADLKAVVNDLLGSTAAARAVRAHSQIGAGPEFDFADTDSMETPAASSMDLASLAEKRRRLRPSRPPPPLHEDLELPPSAPPSRPASGWQRVLGPDLGGPTEPAAPAPDPLPPLPSAAWTESLGWGSTEPAAPAEAPPAPPAAPTLKIPPPEPAPRAPSLRAAAKPLGAPDFPKIELPPDRPAPTSGRSWVPSVVVAAVAALGLGLYALRSSPEAPEPARGGAEVGRGDRASRGKARAEPRESPPPEAPVDPPAAESPAIAAPADGPPPGRDTHRDPLWRRSRTSPPPSSPNPPPPATTAAGSIEPEADPEELEPDEAEASEDGDEGGAMVNLVTVFSLPKGATVELDGTAIGATPLVMPLPLTAGQVVEIKITADGYRPWIEKVAVSQAGALSVTATLEKE